MVTGSASLSEPLRGPLRLRRMEEVGWLVVRKALGAETPELEAPAAFRPCLCSAPCPTWHLFRWWLLCREGSCGELAWGM